MKILITVIRYFFFIIILLLISSCTVKKTLQKCQLIPEENTIKGFDSSAKEFSIPKRYTPGNIEILLDRNHQYEIYNRFYDPKEKFSGYTIVGCKDTTWAKETMAKHLMKKYSTYFYDSSYVKKVYQLNIIDEKKMVDKVMRKDSCIYETIILFNKAENGKYKDDFLCVRYDYIPATILPQELNGYDIEVLFEDRPGKYDFSVPQDMAKNEGIDSYNKYLSDTYGLQLEFVKIDTVLMSVYRYLEL